MRRLSFLKHVSPVFRRNCGTSKHPRQIFSAIQPTGDAHLGNYLGAIKQWVDLQNSEENSVIYGIADLHAITIPKEPEELHNNIFTMAATLLACGIDTNKSILFQQSAIPQHAELCWIIGTLLTTVKLSHLPQYKEKCELVKDPPVGLFLYPVLQTADIMLYRATHIPVGEDQVPQIDLTKHLLKLFNNRFGYTFPKVETLIDPTLGRIKSLADPVKKMSKSDVNPKAVISLVDTPDEILVKCKKALTDFKGQVTYEPEVRPGVANLLLIHSSLTGKSPDEIVHECENLNTGKYKLLLAEVIIEHLRPIRTKINEYLNSREYLVNELENGANKAREIAEKTMKEVKERVGFALVNSRIKTSLTKTAERVTQ